MCIYIYEYVFSCYPSLHTYALPISNTLTVSSMCLYVCLCDDESRAAPLQKYNEIYIFYFFHFIFVLYLFSEIFFTALHSIRQTQSHDICIFTLLYII